VFAPYRCNVCLQLWNAHASRSKASLRCSLPGEVSACASAGHREQFSLQTACPCMKMVSEVCSLSWAKLSAVDGGGFSCSYCIKTKLYVHILLCYGGVIVLSELLRRTVCRSLEQFRVLGDGWRVLGDSKLAEVSCSGSSREKWRFESWITGVTFFGGAGVHRYFYQRKSEWKADRISPWSWWRGEKSSISWDHGSGWKRVSYLPHMFVCLFLMVLSGCWTKLMDFGGARRRLMLLLATGVERACFGLPGDGAC
jgi:hypothetical protein